MEEISLVKDFAVIMVTAGVVTLLFRKLKQPPVLGYLIAGLLVGPYTFSRSPVDDLDTIKLLADLGLVLLLFGLGIEFSWSKIRQVGIAVVIIGAIEILTMIGLGYGVGRLLDWSARDALFLGAALHISSSAIIVKTLRDMDELNRISSKLIIGILVVEDFAAVLIMTILSGVSTTGTADFGDIGSLLLRLFIFIVASLAIGALFVPRIISFTHQFHSKEALLITALGLCFAMALIGKYLGLSVAAGAFLMGALIGDTKFSEEVSEVVAPVRDMFAAIFFIAIGMLIDIYQIEDFIIPAIAVFFVFVFGKMWIDSTVTLLSGYRVRTSIRVGMGMPVMGEFSLAIAKQGVEHGSVAAPIYPVIAVVTAFTSLTGPYITRISEKVANLLERSSPRLVKAYLSRLEEWPQALKGMVDETSEVAQRIRNSIKSVIINMLIVIVIIGTGTFGLHIIQNENFFNQIRDDVVGIVLAFILLTMCAPSFYVIWRNIQSLVDDGAVYVLSRRRSYKGWRYKALRIVIRDSILLVFTVFVIMWFVPLFASLFSIGSYAMLVPIIFSAFTLVLALGFVRQIHSKLSQTFSQAILGEEFVPPKSEIPSFPSIPGKQLSKRLGIRRTSSKYKSLNRDKDDNHQSDAT